MFDDFLRRHSERTGEPFRPFELPRAYERYVDGLPRLDGVRRFLESRGIELPVGSPSDSVGADTVYRLGPL
jgi:hypothetical protein